MIDCIICNNFLENFILLRLGILTYSTRYQRMQVEVSTKYKYFMKVIRVGVGGAAYMRLKSSDIYRDSSGWWIRDYLSRANKNSGLVKKGTEMVSAPFFGTVQYMPKYWHKYQTEKWKKRAVQKYVFFEIDFSVHFFFFGWRRIFNESDQYVFKGD